MKTILCYGDSNTWGRIPETRGRYEWPRRWTGILQNSLGNEYRVIEEGLPGRTACFDDPFSTDRNGLSHLPIVLETNSPIDLLIIMLGTNDMKSYFNLNAFSIARGAAELIIQAKKNIPAVSNILLISPAHITATDNYENTLNFAGGIKKSQELSEHYRYFATQHDCYFFDAATVIISSQVDGIHLDENAHKLLGNALYQETIKILGN